jgi:menin
MEIANELIPHIMKVVSSGHCAHSILKDPECFADLLRLYDGICQWEEGSQTPVLHIGWAKPLVNTISKFEAEVRSKVIILNHDSTEDSETPVLNNNNECCKAHEIASRELFSDIDSKVLDLKDSLHPKIKALTAACGERILNRDFLLQGGGEPFVGEGDLAGTSSEFKLEKSHPTLILHSQKMRGLKDLLLSEKLNTHAISLQLTAQSQVQFGKKTGRDDSLGTRTKRMRRE